MGKRIALIVLILALFAAAGLLAAQWLLIALGQRQLAEERPDAAETTWSRAAAISVFNRWVPLFNRGIARYELARWEASADDFEAASRIAPEDAQCPIRLNWAAALEAGGDTLRESDDLASALARYQQAQLVLAATTCPEESASGGSSLADQRTEARQRLEEKQGAGAPQPPTNAEPDPDSRTERLDSREKQAAEQRARAGDQGDPNPSGEGERTW